MLPTKETENFTMGIRERLLIKANRADAKLEEKSSSWHSAYYHRYFEGWTEIPETAPSGKVRIKRVYTGEFYKADMSRNGRYMHKMFISLLVLLSAMLYVRAALMPLASNGVWYVVLPEVFALCGFIFLVWFLISKLTSPVMLKIREYREGIKNLKLAALLQSLFLTLTAINTILHLLLGGGDGGEIVAAVLFLLAGAAAFGVYLMEKNVKYLRVSNENGAMEGYRIE